MSKPSKRRASAIRNVVLYARVSTVEQADRDLSIPAQLKAMRKYAVDRGYTVDKEYVEPGASGTDANRKVFRRMVEDLLMPSTEVQAVLVYHTSRFMRDAGKARTFKAALRKRGVRVIAIGQETADDPSGHLMEGIFELFDQYESEINGIRTAAAMRENARRGFFNGSNTPFGYRVEKVEVAPGVKRNKLVPAEGEADTLREVFELYVRERGALSVAQVLNDRGIPYRRGKRWSKDLVLKVIEETAPTGVYAWGRRSKGIHVRDDEDTIKIAVDPILDKSLFNMAQQLRARREPRKVAGRTSSSPLLLAGLVRCAKCGEAYQLATTGKPAPDKPQGYRYYNCRSALRVGKNTCGGGPLPVEVLDKAVLEHIAERLFTEEKCNKLLHDLVERTGVLRSQTEKRRGELETELADVTARIDRWSTAFESGEMPADLGAERVRALMAMRNELQETLRKVVPLCPPPQHMFEPANVLRFRSMIRDIFLAGDNALTRHYLHVIVDRIDIDGREVRMTMKPAGVYLLIATGTDGRGTEVRTTVVDWLRVCEPLRGALCPRNSDRIVALAMSITGRMLNLFATIEGPLSLRSRRPEGDGCRYARVPGAAPAGCRPTSRHPRDRAAARHRRAPDP